MDLERALLEELARVGPGGFLWRSLVERPRLGGVEIDEGFRHQLLLSLKAQGLVEAYRVRTESINPALLDNFGKTHTRYRISSQGLALLNLLKENQSP